MNAVTMGVLIHCYWSCQPIPYAGTSGDNAIRHLKATGMLVEVPGEAPPYKVTPKGEAFVEHILKTPLPVQTWTVMVDT